MPNLQIRQSSASSSSSSPGPSGNDFNHPSYLNPLLAFQPAYTYSMPTQLLIYGIVLTLLTVLILHLAFTAKYHYPLASSNFVLLLSAVFLTEISVIVVVVVTNQYLFTRSRFWPFMFDYVEVPMPPSDWKTAQLIGWYLMQGAVTFFAHATHIQFLTLLFPSALEKKLIIAFLGPLCVFSSSLFFTYFLNDPNLQDLGDAIRNTATSTLSLLYTFGLIFWGFIINRKRAWETEGGTVGFGVLAMGLAFGGTAANFIEVKEDRLKWLPWLVNTVLLWQSWAGFWWWVGAGMWSGEVAEIEKREAKKRKRDEKRQRKRTRVLNQLISIDSPSKIASPTNLSADNNHSQDQQGPGSLSSRASVLSRRIRGRRRNEPSGEAQSPTDENQIELEVFDSNNHSNSNLSHLDSPNRSIDQNQISPTVFTEASSTTNETSSTPKRFLSFIPVPKVFERWVGALSEAHNAAAKEQARTAGGIKETEQVKKWGIGPMTQRAALGKVSQRFEDRLRASNQTILKNKSNTSSTSWKIRSRKRRVVGESTDWTSDEANFQQQHEQAELRGSRRRGRVRGGGGEEEEEEEEDLNDSNCSDRLEELRSQTRTSDSGQNQTRPTSRVLSKRRDESIILVSNTESGSSSVQNNQNGSSSDGGNSTGMRSGHSWAWKGPLIKARLKDVTSYD